MKWKQQSLVQAPRVPPAAQSALFFSSALPVPASVSFPNIRNALRNFSKPAPSVYPTNFPPQNKHALKSSSNFQNAPLGSCALAIARRKRPKPSKYFCRRLPVEITESTHHRDPLDILRRFVATPLRTRFQTGNALILVQTNDFTLLPAFPLAAASPEVNSPLVEWKLVRD